MAYVTTGLPNAGVTTYYKVEYDDTLSAADGLNRATALIGVCDSDYNIMNGWFGGIGVPFTLPMEVRITSGPIWSAYWGPPISLIPGNGSALDLVRFMLVAEVVEMMMSKQNLGWFGSGNEGSTGEGLSHFLATQFLISIGSTSRYSNLASTWLNSTRPDWVNNTDPADHSNSPKSACSVLFCWYLCTQLGFSVNAIVGNGSSNLAGVYHNLTGDTGNPFLYFKQLLDAAYPSQTNSYILGPNYDNPFPLGTLSFVVTKSTYGHDEVQDSLSSASAGHFPNAFSLALDGLNSQSLGSTSPAAPSGPAAAFAGISIPPDSLGPQYQTANHLVPQRITFPYDVDFSAASLAAFPAMGSQQRQLNGAITIAGKQFTASVPLTFEAAGNPYFTNVNPAAGNVFWLSQDLRVFTATPGIDPQPVAGGPQFNNDSVGGAYTYIQALLTWLNQTYANPGGTDPFDVSTGLLPGQSAAYTGDSSVTPTTDQGGTSHNNYNFAIARVRLSGTAGTSGQTDNVRVFFRVWGTQTADTDFQPGTTYPSHLDAAGDPDYPLVPADAHTIPFFATGNSPTLTNSSNPEYGTNGVNNKDLQISSGSSVWAYYGCFINVYDPANLVNGVKVQSLLSGDHHCIVAQIAYNGDPIVNSNGTTESPENSDKLAQRNLQVTHSGNPGWPATHRVPQTFDLRRSPAVEPRAGLLGYPDELMIDWGSAPKGTVAQIFWPQSKAAEVVGLASKLYGPHQLSVVDPETIRFEVDGNVTYVPIPEDGPEDLAGLLTLDLPSGVVYGQEFNVMVRRISTRRIERAPGIELPMVTTAGAETRTRTETARVQRTPASAKLSRSNRHVIERVPPGKPGEAPSTHAPTWRYVVGSFQVRIPVTREDKMLPDQEDALAIFKWRLEAMPSTSRWYRVLTRYVQYLSDKVDALGGQADRIPPSLQGRPGKHRHERHGQDVEYRGKVAGIRYDRFGDFAGFTLRLEDGDERSFRGRERAIEELVRTAWLERFLISVYVDRNADAWPEAIVLRRA